MFFSLSFATQAGEWKAVYSRTWADNETGDSGGAIFVRDERGVEHRLTKDGEHAGRPTWAPDGRILFWADIPGREGTIHIMNEDGSNLVTLPYKGYNPVMSENYLVFDFLAGMTSHIGVVDLRTSVFTDLGIGEDPTISPDETRIALDGGGGTIMVSDIQQDTRREVARISAGDTPWFYDNDRIVFTHWNEEDGIQRVAVVDLQTGEITPLAPGGVPSVTGEWVVFGVKFNEVWAMKLDGSERHTLPGIEAGAHVIGDLSLPAEEPRAVQPKGKLSTTWGTLKKR